MAVGPRYINSNERPKPHAVADGTDSPVVSLLYLSGQGIVFKSRRYFETGTKLALGLHLDKVRGDLGLGKSNAMFDLNPFLDVQGFVADCKMTEVADGGGAYQVTLLFDSLDEGDEMLIETIERELEVLKQPRMVAAPRGEVGLN